MNPEAQRIAIAEACGWDNVGCYLGGFHSGYPTWRGRPPGSDKTSRFSVWDTKLVPDYLHDLNAMHEAEKVLTDKQYSAYEELLYDMQAQTLPLAPLALGGKDLYPAIQAPRGYIRACSATAAHRAEAFLRTLNLWEATP